MDLGRQGSSSAQYGTVWQALKPASSEARPLCPPVPTTAQLAHLGSWIVTLSLYAICFVLFFFTLIPVMTIISRSVIISGYTSALFRCAVLYCAVLSSTPGLVTSLALNLHCHRWFTTLQHALCGSQYTEQAHCCE